MKTELKNRTLWFDGTVQVSPELVPELLLRGIPPDKIVVTAINDDILRFNALADEPISESKSDVTPPTITWLIPKKYLDIDLEAYVLPMAESRGPLYAERAKLELTEIKRRGIDNLIKALIYVVDRFKEEKIVYGVGRGSSCASLILYLIGLHCVDPVKHGISHEEFFHD